MKKQFEKFLIDQGYKQTTPSGNPSTVYHYIGWIERVCEKEGRSWIQLAANIDSIVRRYDVGGIEEEYGNQGHRTVINALKRFREFVLVSRICLNAPRPVGANNHSPETVAGRTGARDRVQWLRRKRPGRDKSRPCPAPHGASENPVQQPVQTARQQHRRW